MQGTKLVIEGPFAKSGKTALAVTLGIMKMDQNPDLIGFGNLGIKHDQFEKRKSITPSYFDRDREYLCIIDELDIRYSHQKTYWNEGLTAFWGFGASHNKCAVVVTVQREYNELRRKLLRQCHILIERLFWNSKTNLPFEIAGRIVHPLTYPFRQNIDICINRYDPYEPEVHRIDFYDFTPQVLERDRKNNDLKVEKPKNKLLCEKCGWEWTPKTQNPLVCPRCGKRFGYRVVKA